VAQAYITAVWAYYMSGKRGGRKVGWVRMEKGMGEKEERREKVKEAKVN